MAKKPWTKKLRMEQHGSQNHVKTGSFTNLSSTIVLPTRTPITNASDTFETKDPFTPPPAR